MSAGIEKLTMDNHDLWRRVQHLVRLNKSWQEIVDDIGLVGPRAVQDLAEWMLEYREPKEAKVPMVNSMVLNVPVKSQALLDKGVRLQTWQRQRDGARKALEAIAK